ncbi:zinc transporter ZupT [Halothermothrix orenii]|uniref:zinc transporter ZupT n=1 Tax=Halothermothrix orenii TaxID=31909 RepID=UPI0005A13808
MENVIPAFIITLFAGLSTGIGSALALFARRTNTKFLSISLGFSAGVMVYVSFVELFNGALETLIKVHGSKTGQILAVLSFFTGILIIAIIDNMVPEHENPHQVRKERELINIKKENVNNDFSLKKMGLLSAVAISIHNFPEGIATFASSLSDLTVGVSIAVAIAIHNIPEGVSVSVPIYYATGNKKKAFIYSFMSGLSEPLGALIGYAFFKIFLSDTVLGIIFGLVAGIMVFISIDELLPASRRYGQGHQEIYSFIAGMAVMAISLLLL